MKISKSQLKQIIKEELSNSIKENAGAALKQQLKNLADKAMAAGLDFEELVDQVLKPIDDFAYDKIGLPDPSDPTAAVRWNAQQRAKKTTQ